MKTLKEMKFTTEKNNLVVTIEISYLAVNDHSYFAMTGTKYISKRRRECDIDFCGCIHEEILKEFPEFEIFAKLHLSDMYGTPDYAVSNGIFHIEQGRPDLAAQLLRTTHANIDILKLYRDDVKAFQFKLMDLGIIEQWEKEAREALELLKELTGVTFLYEREVKKGLAPLSDAEAAEVKEKISKGYYAQSAVEARERIKSDRAKEQKRAKAIAKCELTIAGALLDCEIAKIAIDFDVENYIYYPCAGVLTVNTWDFNKLVDAATFEAFKVEIIKKLGDQVKDVTNENKGR